MPINPITKREQVYPDINDIPNFESFNLNQNEEDYNQSMTDMHHSFLFAVINTKREIEIKSTNAKKLARDELEEKLASVSSSKPSLAIWLSELVQNAIDAKWNNRIGATDVSIDFSETRIKFTHNGRPPQHQGLGKNELELMINSGSTKRSDLKTEGRFGIGFKYWTYYFDNVSLSADGWNVQWDKKMNLKPPEPNEFTDGMELVFTLPDEDCSALLSEYIASLETLFSEGVERLINGVSVQTNPIVLKISVNDEEKFRLNHKVDKGNFSTSDHQSIEYFRITNDVSDNLGFLIDCYVPESLIGCDIKQYFDNLEPDDSLSGFQQSQIGLINSLNSEFEDTRKPSNVEILKQEREDESTTWDSPTNIKNTAIRQIKHLDTLCLFDVSEEQTPHHMMYSLFSIEKQQHFNLENKKTKLENRVCFVGTYKVNEERTRLEVSERNNAITHAQLYSFNLLLHLFSEEAFRREFSISNEIYLQILQSFDIPDSEFDSLINSSIISRDEFSQFKVWPVISRVEGTVVQAFIPSSESLPMRPELIQMINHKNPDIRNWARSIIEPNEICFISPEQKGEFSEWITFNPWPTLSSNDEPKYPAILESNVPDNRIIEQIIPLLSESGWPSWMPIPLKSGENEKWYSSHELRDAVIMNSDRDIEGEWRDAFSKSIFEKAKDVGMSFYALCQGFEGLAQIENNTIHGISIEPPRMERLFELSINKLVENNNIDDISSLLQKHGQNHKYWPFFVRSTNDDLLMVRKPSKGWESTFFCMNDCFDDREKSIWSYSRGQRTKFTPILVDRQNDDIYTKLHIRNLTDPTVHYSHLISEMKAGQAYIDGIDNLIREHQLDSETHVPFSKNNYHFITGTRSNSLGNKAKLNIGVYNYYPNTSSETKIELEKMLPPMPNVLHALPMPKPLRERIEMPRFRGKRQNPFSQMYSTNLLSSNFGFARHIFNLIEDHGDKNNDQVESLRTIPTIEINLFDGESGHRTNEENQTDWHECLSNYNESSKNYAFVFRLMSPALASVECLNIASNTRNTSLFEQTFIFSAFEGTYPHRVSPLHAPGTNSQNFQTWYCYITRDSDGQKRQQLQIERARIDTMNQAKGILNQGVYLFDQHFADYKKRVGFSSKDETQILGQSLWCGNEKGGVQGQHLMTLWSTKNDADISGKILKMLLHYADEHHFFPFSIHTLGYQENLRRDGQLYSEIRNYITTDLEKEFLDFEDYDESVEHMVSKWVFNPTSSSIDSTMGDLVRFGERYKNPKFSRVVEAVWKRMNTENPDSEAPCLVRLQNWIRIHIVDWKDIVSDDFYAAIEKSQELSENETLLSKIREAQNYDEALNHLLRKYQRCRKYQPPANWTVFSLIERGMLRENNIVMTKDVSIFATRQGSDEDVPASGFALKGNKKYWYALSNDEFRALTQKPQSKIQEKYIDNLIYEHWYQTLNRYYDAGETDVPHGTTEKDSPDERDSFLQDRIHWLMLSKHQLNSFDGRNEYYSKLPDIQFDYSGTDFELMNDDNSPLYEGLILGPCGWHVEFSDNILTFRTSEPRSKQLLEHKFMILKDLLQHVYDHLGVPWNPRKITNKDFVTTFEVEYSTKCKVDPLVNFDQWYDEYSDDLVEPNQEFIRHLKNGNWCTIKDARSLLRTLCGDAMNWIAKEYYESSDVKPELERMYGNGMTCTLLDYRTPSLSEETNVSMTLVRLHSGISSNPVGVLGDNTSRSDVVENKFMHLGNSLLVSANAHHAGARNNGWRLVAPSDSAEPNFLSYLESNWEELFGGDSNDLEIIQIKGVVKQYHDNIEHDIYGDIVLHKLHILYILSFLKATESTDVE